MKWTTQVVEDRWAYAAFKDDTGFVRYAYVELKDYPYIKEAMRAAIDDVLRQIKEA